MPERLATVDALIAKKSQQANLDFERFEDAIRATVVDLLWENGSFCYKPSAPTSAFRVQRPPSEPLLVSPLTSHSAFF